MSKIDQWIKSNTFHHSQFWDLLSLIEEKEKKGLKVSLCLPALNEEKTIGKEIVIFRSELMERYPIKDVSAWLGNSAPVAMKHYAMARESIFLRATEEGAPTEQPRAKGGECQDGKPQPQITEPI